MRHFLESFSVAELFVSGMRGERRSRETGRRHRPSLLEGECRLVVSTRVSGFAVSPRFRVSAEGPSLPALGTNLPRLSFRAFRPKVEFP